MANHTVEEAPSVRESFVDAVRDILSRGGDGLKFLAIVVAAYLVGRLIRATYMRFQRGRPTSAQLLAGKGIMLLMVFAGAWLGIEFVFQVNPSGLFATLGIVSLALGFGLQNTVANLAAGVSLSLDKPFDVGDRIRVGQTWGDVVSIGFRSTSIRTTAGEQVVVPNAILDTQEVWNYTTRHHAELRLEIPLQISYDSSLPLAEDLILRVVRDTPGVLAYPEPAVLMRAMAADGIDLEVRCWLHDSSVKARVQDKVLRRVKARFEEQGIHVPFPQRTISYLKDGEPPAPTPEHLLEHHAGKPVVVVLVRSPLTSPQTPQHMAQFAKGAGARLVFLHVRPPSSSLRPEQGQAALDVCLQVARQHGLSAHARMEIGAVAPTVAQVLRQEGAKLLVMVRSDRGGIARGWQRAEQQAIQSASPVPVQLLEPDTPPAAKTMDHWHQHLHPEPEEPDEAAAALK